MNGILIATEFEYVTMSLPPVPIKWEGILSPSLATQGERYYVVYVYDGLGGDLSLAIQRTEP